MSQDLLIEIRYYHDPIPEQASAYSRFQDYMSTFHHEYDKWKTLVIDSVTFMELTALKWNQHILNPFKLYQQGKDMRQWYGGAKMYLEEMLMMRCGALPMNVVAVAHVDEEKDEQNGEIVRNPACVGNLRKRLPVGYTEVYHAYTARDEKGVRFYALQTQQDGKYIAATRINAPDPCYPDYPSLWKQWPKDKERPITHTLLYGDAGCGKSTAAATWPTPMLVMCFDPFGKDVPYLNRGVPGKLEQAEDGTYVRRVYAP